MLLDDSTGKNYGKKVVLIQFGPGGWNETSANGCFTMVKIVDKTNVFFNKHGEWNNIKNRKFSQDTDASKKNVLSKHVVFILAKMGVHIAKLGL